VITDTAGPTAGAVLQYLPCLWPDQQQQQQQHIEPVAEELRRMETATDFVAGKKKGSCECETFFMTVIL